MGAHRQGGGVFLPRRRQALGLGSASAYLGAPKSRLAPSGSPRAPSDPGPQPVRAGQKVSVAAGARKTRTGSLPGRSRTGVQCCPTRLSRRGN